MKKYMILLLLGAALSLYASVLSPSGKSLPCEAVTILIPEKPTLAESFAGELLKKYLEKITSRQFQLVREGSAFEKPVISVG
ncbi:MAG: hypothetical protein ACI4UV_02390, partial [Victivallales bacterium]